MLKKLIAKLFHSIIHSHSYSELSRKSSEAITYGFKHFGQNSEIPGQAIIMGSQYISIGDDFAAMYNLRLEAWDNYQNEKFTPQLTIGNNVRMNSDCHIGCINKVVLGNNIVMASRIYISDHSHGKISKEDLALPPNKRPLFSKGPVLIGDNVWIGEGVCILPGVTIGNNAIIGANAVVTKDIPANAIATGIPATVLRILE